MMFPAVDDSTRETLCAFGLFNRIQYNMNREIYVLGQVFFQSALVFIQFDYYQQSVRVGVSLGDELDSNLATILLFVFTSLLLLAFLIVMSILKWRRVKMDKQKWHDIKELEKDYDLLISDEYAQ
mmetsp:Transcript_32158/g.23751  ORF Transcript_32158/g.23751 Transcript_32158/m.23751 type:complete len:125 (+) Transcript_32158:491-865(+)